MKRKEMEYLLRQNGFVLIRQNKHLIYCKEEKTIAIPTRVEYTRGLCRRILQQAGFNKEFIKEIV